LTRNARRHAALAICDCAARGFPDGDEALFKRDNAITIPSGDYSGVTLRA
jgi:hypothetical protein